MKLQILMIVITTAIYVGISGLQISKTPENTPVQEVVDIERVAEASPSAVPIVEATPEGTVAAKTTFKQTAVTGSIDYSLISRINEERRNKGMRALEMTPRLNAIAQCRVNYLRDNNEWSHKNFKNCFVSNGLGKYHFGENLARKLRSDYDPFVGWTNSPTHNKNMFDPRWKYIGVVTDGVYSVATFSTGK